VEIYERSADAVSTSFNNGSVQDAPPWPLDEWSTLMLTTAHLEKAVRRLTEAADFEEFRPYTAPDFVFEIMGGQPASGKWRGIDAMKRHFEAFKENFTADFRFNVTEVIVDPEKRMAAARLHSHPLTDKGGGDYQQHCGWFIYFNDDDKITHIVQYDDTKLVDDVTVRVATTKMRALQ
jgi:ketosteroid isomerase-like protein